MTPKDKLKLFFTLLFSLILALLIIMG